jgi:phospholipase C
MASPIEHVVVLMLENRSFDHLFGFRPGVEGLKGDEVNFLDPSKPESPTNPAFQATGGAPYAIGVGQGPAHSLNATNWQLAANKNGPSAGSPARNTGFVKSYHDALIHDRVSHPTPDQIAVVMESFLPARLPAINALADAFCLCDHWHSEVPGPTQPNRLFIHMGTSAGYVHNVWNNLFDKPTIYNNLEQAGKTWATYDFDANEVKNLTRAAHDPSRFKRFDQFAPDVQGGNLANYSFIVPRMFNGDQPANDQHAPRDARYAEHLIADVYEALVANEDVWNKTALVVTYDEHGGFYDHVIPPAQDVPNPDGIKSPPPGDEAPWVPHFAFDRLGLRVPAVIASPWVQKGKVDSTQYQHTSVLATLKKLFGLQTFLTRRDASAKPFDHLFDELQAPRTDYPKKLPRPPLPVLPARDDPSHPANQPLDSLQQEILEGLRVLTVREAVGFAAESVPTTQADAAEYVRACYARLLGRENSSSQRSSS